MIALVARRIYWDDGKPSMDPEDYQLVAGTRPAGRIHATENRRDRQGSREERRI